MNEYYSDTVRELQKTFENINRQHAKITASLMQDPSLKTPKLINEQIAEMLKPYRKLAQSPALSSAQQCASVFREIADSTKLSNTAVDQVAKTFQSVLEKTKFSFEKLDFGLDLNLFNQITMSDKTVDVPDELVDIVTDVSDIPENLFTQSPSNTSAKSIAKENFETYIFPIILVIFQLLIAFCADYQNSIETNKQHQEMTQLQQEQLAIEKQIYLEEQKQTSILEKIYHTAESTTAKPAK